MPRRLAAKDEWIDLPTVKEIVRHTISTGVLIVGSALVGWLVTLVFDGWLETWFIEADHLFVLALGVTFMFRTGLLLWNRTRMEGRNVLVLA